MKSNAEIFALAVALLATEYDTLANEEADTAFWDAVHERMTSTQRNQLEVACIKATQEECIAAALKILGVQS